MNRRRFMQATAMAVVGAGLIAPDTVAKQLEGSQWAEHEPANTIRIYAQGFVRDTDIPVKFSEQRPIETIEIRPGHVTVYTDWELQESHKQFCHKHFGGDGIEVEFKIKEKKL